MVTGRWQPNANVAPVEWARKMLVDVEATGRTVHWVHVKGRFYNGSAGDGDGGRLGDGGDLRIGPSEEGL